MTPDELAAQQAERDAVKASQRLESKAAVEVNAMYRKQNKEPFGSLPSRTAGQAITTEPSLDVFDGIDIDGAA